MSRSLAGLVLLGFLTFAAPAHAGEAQTVGLPRPRRPGARSPAVLRRRRSATPSWAAAARMPGKRVDRGLHRGPIRQGSRRRRTLLAVPPGVTLSGGHARTARRAGRGTSPARWRASRRATSSTARASTRPPARRSRSASAATPAWGSAAAGSARRRSSFAPPRWPCRTTTAPNFAVGGFRSPAQGTLDLDYAASRHAASASASSARRSTARRSRARAFGGLRRALAGGRRRSTSPSASSAPMVGHLPLQVDIDEGRGRHAPADDERRPTLAGNTKSQTWAHRGVQRHESRRPRPPTPTVTPTPTPTPTATPTPTPTRDGHADRRDAGADEPDGRPPRRRRWWPRRRRSRSGSRRPTSSASPTA